MQIHALVVIPGKSPGKRIGSVVWYESGYYPQYFDRVEWTVEQAQAFCDDFNSRHGISSEIAESAMCASMFGWHVPAADKAIEFFKSL